MRLKAAVSPGKLRNIDESGDLDDVLAALERLTHDLPATELAMLSNFNIAYSLITRNVRQQRAKGAFQHPEFLRQFDTRFAYYYFHALQMYANETRRGGSPPHAWRQAFVAAKSGTVTPLMCMALGVNAHVNNDIPQVLADCSASQKHYRDYLLVNDIIRGSIYEMLATMQADGRLFSPKRRLLQPLYKIGMHRLVAVWRADAWKKFRHLQSGHLTVVDIEQAAHHTTKLLARLPV